MATEKKDTQVFVTMDVKDFIKKIADEDGRLMKHVIDRAVKDYAKKHGLGQ